ncbi:MAG: hypothetical protein ACRC0X_02265 [Brevinema sp.]
MLRCSKEFYHQAQQVCKQIKIHRVGVNRFIAMLPGKETIFVLCCEKQESAVDYNRQCLKEDAFVRAVLKQGE